MSVAAPTAGPGGRPGVPRRTRHPVRGEQRIGLVAGAASLLAAAPLLPIYDGLTWLVPGALAVAVVTGAATGARAVRAPIGVQVLAMGAALALMTAWLFRSGQEWLGLVPNAETVRHLGGLLAALPEQTRTQATPIPDLDPFLLVTTVGIGVIAIIVDVCAAGLRRPALAGLPMLAVYSVPVALLPGVPAYVFMIGVAGYLWLLGADNVDRVRRFGRRFTGDGRGVDTWEPSPLASSGRKLAALGVLLALLAPVAVPGLGSGLIDRFNSTLAGTGDGSGGSGTGVNLFATLDGLLNRDEVVDMLRVQTDDPDPHYLRIGIADQITEDGFDHRRPRGEPVTAGVEPPSIRPGVTPHRHSARVEILSGYSMSRLPVYPEVASLEGLDGNWHHDPDQQVVFAPDGDSRGSRYTVEFRRPEFDPDALREASTLPADDPRTELAAIPAELHEPRVSTLVDGLTEQHDNPYDQVRAIYGHFSTSNGFVYSLETGDATTGSAIVDFLLENKRGYCVQYAAAMAWMVRELGLPARVVIGFTSGRSRTVGTYTLSNHNAHAWTEVYFAGFGWVPFDPTPRSSVNGAVSPDWAPDPDSPDQPDAPDSADDEAPLPPDQDEQVEEETDQGEAGAPAPEDPGTGGSSTLLTWLLPVAVLLAVTGMLLIPAVARARLRRTRLGGRAGQYAGSPPTLPTSPTATAGPGESGGVGAPGGAADGGLTGSAGESSAQARHRAHAAWEELLDTMIDFGVPVDPAESPRRTITRLIAVRQLDGAEPPAADTAGVGVGPPAAGVGATAARLLGTVEERARYARTPLTTAELPAAVQAVRQAVADSSTRRERLRAMLLPPSTVARWWRGIGGVLTGVTTAAQRASGAVGKLSPRRLFGSSS